MEAVAARLEARRVRVAGLQAEAPHGSSSGRGFRFRGDDASRRVGVDVVVAATDELPFPLAGRLEVLVPERPVVVGDLVEPAVERADGPREPLAVVGPPDADLAADEGRAAPRAAGRSSSALLSSSPSASSNTFLASNLPRMAKRAFDGRDTSSEISPRSRISGNAATASSRVANRRHCSPGASDFNGSEPGPLAGRGRVIVARRLIAYIPAPRTCRGCVGRRIRRGLLIAC